MIGVQELYIGCFGVGFLLTAGSLVFSGGKAKGSRGGGRGSAKVIGRGTMRGGQTRSALGRVAAPKANLTNVRGAAVKSGVRAPAKASAGASKVTMKSGTARGGKVNSTTNGGAGHSDASAGSEHLSQTYLNTTQSAETDNLYLEQAFFFLMGIINPMSIALMIFFFGATGLLILRYLPGIPTENLWPALVGALLASSVTQHLLGWIAAKVENPELHLSDDVVGSVGEISVTIQPGKLGEVVFVLGLGRKNYQAKAMDPNKQIKRGTRVLIIDFEDNIAWVEAEEDLYLDADDVATDRSK